MKPHAAPVPILAKQLPLEDIVRFSSISVLSLNY